MRVGRAGGGMIDPDPDAAFAGVRRMATAQRETGMPYKDADRARQYQREYRRTRRSGDRCTTPVHPAIPIETRLRTAADVIDLLEDQIGLVRGDPGAGTLEKARTVGYLLSVGLKAIEAGNLFARIEMLEAILKHRKNPE